MFPATMLKEYNRAVIKNKHTSHPSQRVSGCTFNAIMCLIVCNSDSSINIYLYTNLIGIVLSAKYQTREIDVIVTFPEIFLLK